jgi:hypothetical protein
MKLKIKSKKLDVAFSFKGSLDEFSQLGLNKLLNKVIGDDTQSEVKKSDEVETTTVDNDPFTFDIDEVLNSVFGDTEVEKEVNETQKVNEWYIRLNRVITKCNKLDINFLCTNYIEDNKKDGIITEVKLLPYKKKYPIVNQPQTIKMEGREMKADKFEIAASEFLKSKLTSDESFSLEFLAIKLVDFKRKFNDKYDCKKLKEDYLFTLYKEFYSVKRVVSSDKCFSNMMNFIASLEKYLNEKLGDLKDHLTNKFTNDVKEFVSPSIFEDYNYIIKALTNAIFTGAINIYKVYNKDINSYDDMIEKLANIFKIIEMTIEKCELFTKSYIEYNRDENTTIKANKVKEAIEIYGIEAFVKDISFLDAEEYTANQLCNSLSYEYNEAMRKQQKDKEVVEDSTIKEVEKDIIEVIETIELYGDNYISTTTIEKVKQLLENSKREDIKAIKIKVRDNNGLILKVIERFRTLTEDINKLKANSVDCSEVEKELDSLRVEFKKLLADTLENKLSNEQESFAEIEKFLTDLSVITKKIDNLIENKEDKEDPCELPFDVSDASDEVKAILLEALECEKEFNETGICMQVDKSSDLLKSKKEVDTLNTQTVGNRENDFIQKETPRTTEKDTNGSSKSTTQETTSKDKREDKGNKIEKTAKELKKEVMAKIKRIYRGLKMLDNIVVNDGNECYNVRYNYIKKLEYKLHKTYKKDEIEDISKLVNTAFDKLASYFDGSKYICEGSKLVKVVEDDSISLKDKESPCSMKPNDKELKKFERLISDKVQFVSYLVNTLTRMKVNQISINLLLNKFNKGAGIKELFETFEKAIKNPCNNHTYKKLRWVLTSKGL